MIARRPEHAQRVVAEVVPGATGEGYGFAVMKSLQALAILVFLLGARGVALGQDADRSLQAPRAPSIPPPAPLVAIDSTRPFTVLERRANTVAGWSFTLPFPAYILTTQWEPICVTPCELRLDPNAVYRVGGGGVAPSGAFTLPRDHDPLRLHVHAGSSFLHDAGIVLTAIGAVSIIAGVVFVGASTVETNPERALRAGVAFFVPGVAGLVLGTLLWVANGSSVVAEDGRSL